MVTAGPSDTQRANKNLTLILCVPGHKFVSQWESFIQPGTRLGRFLDQPDFGGFKKNCPVGTVLGWSQDGLAYIVWWSGAFWGFGVVFCGCLGLVGMLYYYWHFFLCCCWFFCDVVRTNSSVVFLVLLLLWMALCCFVSLRFFRLPFFVLDISRVSWNAIVMCSVVTVLFLLILVCWKQCYECCFLTLFWPCFTVCLLLPMLWAICRLCLPLRFVYDCNM